MTFLFWENERNFSPGLFVYINPMFWHSREQLPSSRGHFVRRAGFLMDCDRCALIGIDYQYASFVFFITPFPSFTKKPKEFNKIRHTVLRLFIISRLVQSFAVRKSSFITVSFRHTRLAWSLQPLTEETHGGHCNTSAGAVRTLMCSGVLTHASECWPGVEASWRRNE